MDREKVIQGLEGISDYFFDIFRNGTDSYKCAKAQEYSSCAIDAIALLKEQEKAKVVFGRCKDGSFVTECGHCGTYLDKAYSICPKCNKELDWNSNQH